MSRIAEHVALTIPITDTDSPALSTVLTAGQLKIMLGSMTGITIHTPAALTGVCVIQVVPLEGLTTWQNLQANGTDVALAAVKATFVPMAGFSDMRIHSASAEGAARTFNLVIQIEVD